ncbi:uncharacterized protein RCC_03292 [Ramularia collo-cygni]|uniref:FAD-binding PCMH-type domain-containing protein n=1 Tax=Ramularia collo-cygni TaxID=112498 RepID=A0A2D3US08_9PEZI|nr:uncharacterized protein RCC_03292 [Ramularia collo-cygni]CZT17458.1 uncharacterized protein RCC_03292 [Ramularia collo-cygni]
MPLPTMTPSERESHFHHLTTLCSEFYTPTHPSYSAHSTPWSLHSHLSPQLVLLPATLQSLQAILAYLYPLPGLPFSIRNTGTGGSSSPSVLISMSHFNSFAYDPSTSIATVGAGLSWGEVDTFMEEATDGEMACVGARCTWVGVTGSTLVGGLSWLSQEWGMISDPQNLLDAQVILWDGRIVWAVQDGYEDLMWGVRGGGGGFGVVTALKFRAHPVPKNAFAGVILLPYESLQATSTAVAKFSTLPSNPKTALHITNQGPGMGQQDQGPRPGLALLPVDFLGEAHARSAEGFGWIYSLPGAKELVSGEMSYRQVNALADSFKSYQGKNMFWACAPLLEGRLEEGILERAWTWYEECYGLEKGFGSGSTVLLEFMQEKAFSSTSGREATAWPHSGHRHVMQLVLGCRPEDASPGLEEVVMRQLEKAGKEIGRERFTGEYHPGFLHSWNDVKEVYGDNFERLVVVKEKYDPLGRFEGNIDWKRGRVMMRNEM